MNKVLIITYHFTPQGGPAVQRISKFAKFWPMYGYEPFILTAHPKSKIFDPSLLNDFSENVFIKKARDYGLYIPGELRKKIFSNLFLPDKHVFWRLTAIRAGIRLIKKMGIDIIFSTSPPHSFHLVARQIAHETKLPWVADFRDEWTTYPSFYKQKNQHIHYKLEGQVLEHCTQVVTVTNISKKNFSQKLEHEKITVIPNGYDADDFTSCKKKNQTENKHIKITYCGRLNQLHSPDKFFSTLISLTKDSKKLSEELSINVIGNIENKKYIKNYPQLIDMVNFFPYQSHKKCIQSMADSTILLLLATNMASTEFIPAKLYEYIYLRKPIFAVVSFPGELSELLKEYGNSYVAFENETDSIKNKIINMKTDWEMKKNAASPKSTFIKQFDRKYLTKDLSKLFNRILREN